jgi:alpha-tubulin suppressor-like RCC1 family protein
VAILDDGTVWGRGANSLNQMGFASTGDVINWTRISSSNNFNNASEIVGGYYSTYVLKEDGSAWMIGRNDFQHAGYAGTILNQFVSIGDGTNNSDFTQIYASRQNFVGRKSDGSIWGLGENDGTQLGYTARTPVRTYLTKISPNNTWTKVIAGSNRIYALHTNGTIWGFGQQPSFLSSPTYVHLGTQLGFYSDFIDFATNSGGDFIYGLRSDGSVWGMGYHLGGYKYFGNIADSVYTGWTRVINGFTGVKSIKILGNFTGVAIKTDGTVWGIGQNTDFLLGPSGSFKNTWTQISSASGVWDNVYTTVTNIFASREVV